MVGLTALQTAGATLPILVCFGATQAIWPLLSVASNNLAVTLEPGRQAENVGLLNAATAVGATVGGVLGGILLQSGLVWLCTAVLLPLLVAALAVRHAGLTERPAADA